MSRSLRRRSRALKWLETLLLLAGLAGIGILVWSKVSETVYQKWADRSFQRQVEQRQAESSAPTSPPPPRG